MSVAESIATTSKVDESRTGRGGIQTSQLHSRAAMVLNKGEVAAKFIIRERDGINQYTGDYTVITANDEKPYTSLLIKTNTAATPVVVSANTMIDGKLSVHSDMGVEDPGSIVRARKVVLYGEGVNSVSRTNDSVLNTISHSTTEHAFHSTSKNGDVKAEVVHTTAGFKISDNKNTEPLLQVTTGSSPAVSATYGTISKSVVLNGDGLKLHYLDGEIEDKSATHIIDVTTSAKIKATNIEHTVQPNSSGTELSKAGAAGADGAPSEPVKLGSITIDNTATNSLGKIKLESKKDTGHFENTVVQLEPGGLALVGDLVGLNHLKTTGEVKIAGQSVRVSPANTFEVTSNVAMHQLTASANTDMTVATDAKKTNHFLLKAIDVNFTGDRVSMPSVFPSTPSVSAGKGTIEASLAQILTLIYGFFHGAASKDYEERLTYFSDDFVNMERYAQVEQAFQNAIDDMDKTMSFKESRIALSVLNKKITSILGLTPPETLNSIRELAAKVLSSSSDVGFSVATELSNMQAMINNLYLTQAALFPSVPDPPGASYLLYDDMFKFDLNELPRCVIYSKGGTERLHQLTEPRFPTSYSDITPLMDGTVIFYLLKGYHLTGSGLVKNATGEEFKDATGTNVLFANNGPGYITLDGTMGFFYDVSMQKFVFCKGLDLHSLTAESRTPQERAYKSIWTKLPLTTPRELGNYTYDPFYHSFGSVLHGGSRLTNFPSGDAYSQLSDDRKLTFSLSLNIRSSGNADFIVPLNFNPSHDPQAYKYNVSIPIDITKGRFQGGNLGTDPTTYAAQISTSIRNYLQILETNPSTGVIAPKYYITRDHVFVLDGSEPNNTDMTSGTATLTSLRALMNDEKKVGIVDALAANGKKYRVEANALIDVHLFKFKRYRMTDAIEPLTWIFHSINGRSYSTNNGWVFDGLTPRTLTLNHQTFTAALTNAEEFYIPAYQGICPTGTGHFFTTVGESKKPSVRICYDPLFNMGLPDLFLLTQNSISTTSTSPEGIVTTSWSSWDPVPWPTSPEYDTKYGAKLKYVNSSSTAKYNLTEITPWDLSNSSTALEGNRNSLCIFAEMDFTPPCHITS